MIEKSERSEEIKQNIEQWSDTYSPDIAARCLYIILLKLNSRIDDLELCVEDLAKEQK
jgi:hypothetical protein